MTEFEKNKNKRIRGKLKLDEPFWAYVDVECWIQKYHVEGKGLEH